ncbi:DUF4160 domain-containing protein [Rhodoferax sp. 4810]|uniref:DUF4160 domain-containing protein n=1 Tax=Thiospirillum jenense TaxID=1653858 RepID=A0A839H2C5_9GAMM|nr:DUF4160 domain-containing protein [Thiospirillum jenense]MBB1073176.1 DUF4160 domain-containing protein [Rhodoferax jenense]MBB1124663.1 DUF4160 domain-containing protein [Thiospirillum jenense]
MPTISMFYGMVIQMFFREHCPPHFHVKYGDYKAIIAINPPELTEGKLPRRALNLVLDWAELHQSELLENWQLCQTMQHPKSVAPLE